MLKQEETMWAYSNKRQANIPTTTTTTTTITSTPHYDHRVNVFNPTCDYTDQWGWLNKLHPGNLPEMRTSSISWNLRIPTQDRREWPVDHQHLHKQHQPSFQWRTTLATSCSTTASIHEQFQALAPNDFRRDHPQCHWQYVSTLTVSSPSISVLARTSRRQIGLYSPAQDWTGSL